VTRGVTTAVARAALAALVVALCLVVTRAARAEAPCKGCRLTLPAGDGPAPLLVVLHGDRQDPRTPHDAWTRLATKRGIGVLTLACPADLGCKGSFWQWDGEPSWVTDQIAKVDAARVDRDRLWLVGWSGGASWIGMHAQAFSRAFAAVVIHGGGVAPADGTCGDAKAPVYFHVGDKNPLHALAIRLRAYHTSCAADLTWDLVRGADHEGEWAALPTHGKAVMDWLVAHPRAKTP